MILGLDLLELLLHNLEVAMVFLDLLLVFRSDVGMAQQHQVVDVVACIEQQPADSRVGHDVFGKHDGAEVK